jgi:alpha-1,3-rhamnosyltransferase
MDNNNHPLVSVFVVTYNAGDYINETLDSIKAQTYDNIELIVSDDHSSDETVRLANDWIEKNKKRFVRTEVITVEHNTGVSANYNRAVRACRGLWVKNVDGDDLLYADCIENNIDFVLNNPEVSWTFSNAMVFKGHDVNNIIGEYFTKEMTHFFELDASDQFISQLNNNVLPSQTCFIKLDLLRKYPYNEKYKGLEDAPMWLTLTKNGHKAYYFDKCTSYYRRDESMTSSNNRFFSPIWVESFFSFFWSEKINYIRDNNLIETYNSHRKLILTIELADVLLKNKKNIITNWGYKFISFLIFKFAKFKL